ncbi:MAG: transglutaminase domain-containing protein [Sandaracinaceae bacterium]|nr:transglutaminase domain-containing protein [Sandaracinaceae bacterium]
MNTSAPRSRPQAAPVSKAPAPQQKWGTSFTLAACIYFAMRGASALIHDAELTLKVEAVILVVAIVVPALRIALLRVLGGVFVLVVAIYVGIHRDEVRQQGVAAVAMSGARLFLGRAGAGVRGHVLRQRVRVYLDAVHVVQEATRADPVFALADDLVGDCGNADFGCEVQRITQGVAARVPYRSDPSGSGGDHVQPAMTTWDRPGGDCEDQAILLLSLYRAHGLEAYAAITANHMFAVVCAAPDSQRTTRPESILSRPDCQVADTTITAQLRPMSAMPAYNVTGLYDVDGRDVLAGQ